MNTSSRNQTGKKKIKTDEESLSVGDMVEDDDGVTGDDEDDVTRLHQKYPYHSELNRRGYNVCLSRMCSGHDGLIANDLI